MKGLFIRIVAAVALLLWAIDMVFPWQQIMRSEQNRYNAIQQRGVLVVGTINNPVSYFIGSEGQSGLEYELSKAFADYLGVKLEMRVKDNAEELFAALERNEIDIAAANLCSTASRNLRSIISRPSLSTSSICRAASARAASTRPLLFTSA